MIKIYDPEGSGDPDKFPHYRKMGHSGKICFYGHPGFWKKTWTYILAKLILFKWWLILSWHHLKIQFKIKAKIYGRINRNN